jgi:hypothetical protein
MSMKNSVFWDIKTQFVPHRRHCISATQLSRLILCKILGFHGGDYEQRRLLGCYTVTILRSNVSEERIASIIRVTKFRELGTMLAVTSNRITLRRTTTAPSLVTLMIEAISQILHKLFCTLTLRKCWAEITATGLNGCVTASLIWAIILINLNVISVYANLTTWRHALPIFPTDVASVGPFCTHRLQGQWCNV